MNSQPNLPNFEELFGDLDFKTGDDARSVYSPAAYLADLLQLLDDEFQADENPVFAKRSDLKELLLNADNTFTLTPYLDIVNEILENKIPGDAYQALKEPSTLRVPFNLENERVKQALGQLGITPDQLYKLFANRQTISQDTTATAYLGLSEEETAAITVPTSGQDLLDRFGNPASLLEIQTVSTFLQITGLRAPELRDLLFLNLSEEEKEAGHPAQFFVNQGLPGYADLDQEEETIVLKSDGTSSDAIDLPESWFDRTQRFIRLAWKLKLPFADLDLILRSCCGNTLDALALQKIAVVLRFHRRFDLPIDAICALFAPINTTGYGHGDKPTDLFNRVFNTRFAPADQQYLPGAEPLPETYTEEEYSELTYTGDLREEHNRPYRERLSHALHLTEKDLQFIFDTFEEEELDSSLWSNPERQHELLAILFRVAYLTRNLDLSVSDFFDLFEILDKDPSVQIQSSFVPLIEFPVPPKSCLDILTSQEPNDGMWLVQLLAEIAPWMHKRDLSTETLHQILTGLPPTRDEEKEEKEILRQAQEKVLFLDQVNQQFRESAISPASFAGELFDQREARAVFKALRYSGQQLLSEADARFLRYQPENARQFAYQAVHGLDHIYRDDFKSLGLEEKISDKIFNQLVFQGYLTAEGTLRQEKFPMYEKDFQIETDFEPQREAIFQIIHDLYAEAKGPETHGYEEHADTGAETYGYAKPVDQADEEMVEFSLFPSDLQALELSEGQRKELYDNLVFNGFIDAEGLVLKPQACSHPGNKEKLLLNAGLTAHAAAIFETLKKRIEGYKNDALALDRSIFDGLDYTESELEALVENLRFNEYLSPELHLRDKIALLDLPVRDFHLSLQFYPQRRRILDALQTLIGNFKANYFRIGRENLSEVADDILANRIYQYVRTHCLEDHRLREDKLDFFRNAENADLFDLGKHFDAHTSKVVFQTLHSILLRSGKYQLTPAALEELEFDANEQEELLELLKTLGHLDSENKIPEGQLPFFLKIDHALEFALDLFEDFNKDIFFLLHDIAKETDLAVRALDAQLATLAAQQESLLLTALQEMLELEEETTKILLRGILGEPKHLVEAFMRPVLTAVDSQDRISREPLSNPFNFNFRRMQQLARLVNHLNLSPAETEVVLRDQDLVEKFPENLVLPEGVQQFDALLEGSDGLIYLFVGDRYHLYLARDYSLLSSEPDDPELEALIEEDEYLQELLEQPNTLQNLLQTDAPIARIDAAFADQKGNAYLVSGNDYFYQKKGTHYWARKPHEWGELESKFEMSDQIDAAFQDDAGRTYLFFGDHYLRYSESYEKMDDGYPKKIAGNWKNEGQASKLPWEFQTRIDAAFQDEDRKTYYFKDEQFVSSAAPDQPQDIREMWGKVRNNFAEAEKIDAACQIGHETFLFAGDQVIAYQDCLENEDVRVSDGYPKTLEMHLPHLPGSFQNGITAAFEGTDGTLHLFRGNETIAYGEGNTIEKTRDKWGVVQNNIADLGQVDAAFVGLDGKTYLFSGDQYVCYSGDSYTWVDEGYPRTISEDWGGLSRVDAALVLNGKTYLFETLDSGQQQYVCYSTRDYTTPDEDEPELTSDNWLSLPFELIEEGFELASIDSVFTAPNGKTYLFKDDRFVVFDHAHRWWSEVQSIASHWDSLPFDSVDAAFAGKNGKVYLFSGQQYVRFSGKNYNQVDDRHPRAIGGYWGRVKNNIAETGKVDAAVVVSSEETIDDVTSPVTYTYLFSGNQFFRYRNEEYAHVEPGYPRYISTSLKEESRFENLSTELKDGIDAAFADKRNVYLFEGNRYHVIADEEHTTIPYSGRANAGFIDEGSFYLEKAGEWTRYSHLENKSLRSEQILPPVLREVPTRFQTELNAVLHGVDDNTYVFKGEEVFNVSLNRAYKLGEEWGRVKNNVYQNDTIDAAFVGLDGKTYLFSGEQYLVYEETITSYENATTEWLPRPIDKYWAGLSSVNLAFVRDGKAFIFEKPDEEGNFRYLCYSTSDYSKPDEGFPQTANFDIWGISEEYQQEGFDEIDTLLAEGDNLLFIRGERFLQFNFEEQTWAQPKPLDRIWEDIPLDHQDFKRIKAVFTGVDGALYFFSENYFVRYADGTFTAPEPIHETWGITESNFISNPDGNRVDAAYVFRGITYLFSGDQYVRYSGKDYRYVDMGYPKEIVANLRMEPPFKQLPGAFDDAIAAQIAANEPVLIDAVFGSRNSTCVLVNNRLFVGSETTHYRGQLGHLGQVKNTIQEENRVDAAYSDGEGAVFLLAGDQCFRYSEGHYDYVDDGFPQSISSFLENRFFITSLPTHFTFNLDAAFKGMDGNYLFFKGNEYLDTAIRQPQPISGNWDSAPQAFFADPADRSLDAAFVSPSGKFYLFKDGQYLRYATPWQEYPDEGYPQPIRDNWGDMPVHFEEGVDGAFVFEGKTYFIKGDTYIRYSDRWYKEMDSIFPQKFYHRWGEWNDFLLSDLQAITQYKHLADNFRSGDHSLTDLLHPGNGPVKKPYTVLADIFGWDVEEVRWVKRNNGFLSPQIPFEADLHLELLLKMYEVLSLTRKASISPAYLHQVWKNLHLPDGNPTTAADKLYAALGLSMSEKDWETLSGQLHDNLNQLKRDALVSYVLAHEPEIADARQLYEQLLIDVQMSGCATTSRIKEAIAAVQLYMHRYFLNLEQGDLKGNDDENVRKGLQERWKWLKSYRTWEANRKVFLYPENYLRPELRDTKTPAFQTFENDLLQSEITEAAVEKVYKKYLDEYTEVSRLSIAGGYVYDEPGALGTAKKLILFGHTKTSPKRYYYRQARFPEGTPIWEPWLPVNVQIDAERVYPVFAFGRTFVFWTNAEAVVEDVSETQITVTTQGNDQIVKNKNASRHVIKIHYAFYDLNKEWVQVQTLAGEVNDVQDPSDIELFVENSENLFLAGDISKHENIIVNCSFLQRGHTVPSNEAFVLTPELYSEPTERPLVQNQGRTIFASLFNEPTISEARVNLLNTTEKSSDLPWFSFDHKGGSFLCKPATPPLSNRAWPQEIADDRRLPEWDKIDAAFHGPDGRSYFFNTEKGVFVTSDDLENEQAIDSRWGFGAVDAAYTQGDNVFLLRKDKFLRYGFANGAINTDPDAGYPKTFMLRGTINRVKGAFTITVNGEYRVYLIGDKGVVRYTRSTQKLFDNVKYVGSGLKSILNDLDIDFSLPLITHPTAAYYRPDQNKLFLHFYTNVFQLSPLGFFKNHSTLEIDMNTKTAVRKVHKDDPVNIAWQSGPTTFFKSGSTTYDAAFVAEFQGTKTFYAFKGEEYIESTQVPANLDQINFQNPEEIAEKWGINKIDASFTLDGKTHLWTNDLYYTLENGEEPALLSNFRYINGNWGNIPADLKAGFDASLNTGDRLYLFKGNQYLVYNLFLFNGARPFQIKDAPYEIIRLTASTGYKLNQKLFSGGIPSLLSLATQEEDELPAFSRDTSNPTTIQVKDKVTAIPASSHLDFFGANGIYYWEMFFHAPFLIAQSFNTEQKFAEAKDWYEYIYDPTQVTDYWKFLPFLSIDLKALIRSFNARIEEEQLDPDTIELRYSFQTRTLSQVLTHLQDILDEEDEGAAFNKARQMLDIEAVSEVPDSLGELIPLLRQLHVRMSSENPQAAIEAYLDDPFDPHAIADLRHSAYQKALVMQYIDNLIDWGDAYFRKNTMESIDEARMLYLLAYELLGDRPDNLGQLVLPEEGTFEQLTNSFNYDFLVELEDDLDSSLGDSSLVSGGGGFFLNSTDSTDSGSIFITPVILLDSSSGSFGAGVNESVANPYFFVPQNDLLTDYWNRVEDRLYKIRQCLNIDGVRQALPLFSPPLDPLALVQSAASGALAASGSGDRYVSVPHYRFSFMIMKAQDLATTLTRFGIDMLGAIERRDSEALGNLHSSQERIILEMAKHIREAQLGEIEENLSALHESKANASQRKEHYDHLISEGMLGLEIGQVAMMSLGATLQTISAGLNVASGGGAVAPDALVGPFIMGVKYGGSNAGASLSSWAQASEVAGEAATLVGEVLGIFAQHKRMEQDWEIQLKIAESDEREIDAQIASVEWRKKAAQRELVIHEKEIEHHDAISRFMKDKFSNEDLYRWLSSKLAGLFQQSYQLAYDLAKQAEKAFQFECGLKESEVNFIQPVYWNSLRKGLLSGESLITDLNRMEKAYLDQDSRGLEITKNISLIELDPLAFLDLKSKGACEFSLNEALFDYDFPGHYCRQVKTLAVTFELASGKQVMATLTQLHHKTVLEADTKAVKFLLDPKGRQPEGIRTDWRARQQVALSHHTEFEQNNGIFELRFDSNQYLPFEGTGAVSTWRLELNGKKGSYNPSDLVDVTLNLKYTAKQGGQGFADAVRGMLKPYQTVRFLDMHFDFPGEWNEFIRDDSDDIFLPIQRNLFPNMRGSKIDGILAKYDLVEDGPMNIALATGDELPLPDGKFVATPGLSIPSNGTEMGLTIKGDKANLRNIQLVVSYTANA